jgi:pilus assembly protein FimV
MKTLAKLLICPLLVGFPITTFALGLGSLRIHSGFEEALDAEIDLRSVDSDTLAQLKVTLASPEEFAHVGLDRSAHLMAIEFDVSQDSGGNTTARLTTTQPFREPVLHILVVAQWPGGRLTREYSELLEPPQSPDNQEMSAADQEISEAEEMVAAATEPVPESATRTEQTEDEPTSPQPSQAENTFGPTKTGDTLAAIAAWALAMNGAGDVTKPQMIVALLHDNPDAFIDGDVNFLKVGQTLLLPSSETISATSAQQAAQFISKQYAAFEERNHARESASKNVAATPMESNSDAAVTTASNAAADNEEAAMAEKAEQLQNDASKMEQELSYRKEKNQDLQSLVDKLEEELKDMMSLTKVNDEKLADFKQ